LDWQAIGKFAQDKLEPVAWREKLMITFEITTEVKDDRRIVLTLPPEVPTGQAKLVVTVNSPTPDKKPTRTSLADWAEANAENWGDRLSSEDVEGFTGRRF
jgi:hypothetical protein